MAENQDGQEKSHAPTAKRRQEARRKGQVPRSRELNTTAITMFGVGTVILLGPHFAKGFHRLFEQQFVLDRTDIFDPNAATRHFVAAIQDALLMLSPLFAVMIVVAILSSIALGGFNVSAEAMKPKFGKLNAIKGLKRLVSTRGLMELVKAIAKFALIGSATLAVLYLQADKVVVLGSLNVEEALRSGLSIVGWSALLLSSTLILLALIDVPFQLWQHTKGLKMTQQEVRDELKDTEGRPEVRSRIRKVQFEMAARRMMQEVPKADVIVTNPTHYSVALRYDSDRMKAPVVVAKGKGLIAANIREIGARHQVPLVEAPVLARAIYFNTEINHPIPAALFLAVAQLLAYVFQLRAYREMGGDIPTPPQDYPVPDDYRRDG
ncbi:MAG: flagellar biosynthesis protein FlhB [Chromatiaceae bacterium]|nr:flagellar biosynthesis protein FlhB [Chromatiaceae bacterium]MCP5312552.1 flagellar biosynthesis protein FlhB [Chromatiaceae bacterium]